MELKLQIRSPEESRGAIKRIVGENLDKKINSYLNKFEKKDAEGKIDLKVEKNKKGLFDGILQINIDGRSFRYKREDFKNLDDLVNHLFDHFKEELASE